MTSAEGRPRILVVDDDDTIVDFLTLGLEGAGFEVVAARDGHGALAAADSVRPHLIILDWMLPGVDGLHVCRQLRARSTVPILMLTAKGELDDRVEGLDSGADDYLPKPFKLKELLARVRALLRRANVGVQRVLRAGELTLNRDTHEVYFGARELVLTPREYEILELLMTRPRQVFTRETILGRIWGVDLPVETNVVDVHVSSLREKLGDRKRTLIRTVRGVGFRLRV